MGGFNDMMGGYGFGGGWMLLFGVVVIALLVWLVLAVARSQSGSRNSAARGEEGKR